VKGRGVIALVLFGFVCIAAGVIWRRSTGIARARAESGLEQRRAALRAERTKLEGDIRDASSRAALARVAEDRLHMRIPNDSQVIVLSRSSVPVVRAANDPSSRAR